MRLPKYALLNHQKLNSLKYTDSKFDVAFVVKILYLLVVGFACFYNFSVWQLKRVVKLKFEYK